MFIMPCPPCQISNKEGKSQIQESATMRRKTKDGDIQTSIRHAIAEILQVLQGP